MINPVVYNVSLDIYKIGSQKVLSMVRGDTKRSIVIHLTENERPYSLVAGCTAKFTALKPDGKFIYNDCEVDFKNNTITYQVTPQTTAVNGRVDCQLRLIGDNGGIISTPSFSIVVADLLYNEEPIVKSSTEFNALTRCLADLQEKLANGDFNGKSIYVRGSVGDPSELDAKIPKAEAGDGYIAENDHLYVFDGEKFVDVGLVRGPQGFSGVYVGPGEMPENCNVQIDPEGDVLEIDTKLDVNSKNPVANKAVVEGLASRANAGYGYGETIVLKTVELEEGVANEVNIWMNSLTNSWSVGTAKQIWIIDNGFLSASIFATVFKVSDTNTLVRGQTSNGYFVTKYKIDDVWSDWLWENPPMRTGIEYATTECYDGKVVYAKKVELYSMAGTTLLAEHGISNLDKLVSITGVAFIANGDTEIIDVRELGSSVVSDEYVRVESNRDISDYTCYVTLKYTKKEG